jgi:hypothetical protein
MLKRRVIPVNFKGIIPCLRDGINLVRQNKEFRKRVVVVDGTSKIRPRLNNAAAYGVKSGVTSQFGNGQRSTQHISNLTLTQLRVEGQLLMYRRRNRQKGSDKFLLVAPMTLNRDQAKTLLKDMT